MYFLQPPNTSEVVSAIRAVRKYNEDLMKGRACTSGEEQAPPIPLKKKTGQSTTVFHTSVYKKFTLRITIQWDLSDSFIQRWFK